MKDMFTSSYFGQVQHSHDFACGGCVDSSNLLFPPLSMAPLLTGLGNALVRIIYLVCLRVR